MARVAGEVAAAAAAAVTLEDVATELTTALDATPEATMVEAAEAAPVVVAAPAAAAPVLVAAEEATPPVPAAARTEETEVHAGFLERFSSYRQASPAPVKVEGTQEY